MNAEIKDDPIPERKERVYGNSYDRGAEFGGRVRKKIEMAV